MTPAQYALILSIMIVVMAGSFVCGMIVQKKIMERRELKKVNELKNCALFWNLVGKSIDEQMAIIQGEQKRIANEYKKFKGVGA